jgi:hypothetical protein
MWIQRYTERNGPKTPIIPEDAGTRTIIRIHEPDGPIVLTSAAGVDGPYYHVVLTPEDLRRVVECALRDGTDETARIVRDAFAEAETRDD